MSSLRFKVVEEASNRKPVTVEIPKERPQEYYASKVFNRKKMFEYLPIETYKALIYAIDNKEPLSRSLADSVAAGMKQWAIDNGVRHYTHWFQPLTETTAEKHDSFVEHDGKGGMVEKFSGKLLVQQEPDASSFPNGGIRNTFAVESLDYKTPLLRALSAVDKAGTAVARYFDQDVQHVISNLGWEQEYFLVDEALYTARPDLVLTGRTLMGHESAKNQQLEDHYFGAIPRRVEAFMLDLEIEAHKLGIPCKTRHNEVAPNQFELAPIFEETNLANDHNMLLMSVMNEVARRHNFRVLLHEKPFAGINGSGKHNNWSLGTDTGTLLFAPGKTPIENLQFITFVANVMAAVHRHNGLLKASIMSATNCHRLGANEAPPAIISIFTGTQLAEVLNKIKNSDKDELIELSGKDEINLGVAQIPELMIDNTDRNRTSPFAFTGNRFEFRAVGSSANCASAMIALNAAMAEQLTDFKSKVDSRLEAGEELQHALLAEIKSLLLYSEPIHFDGNGYSDEWKEEASRRGLDCETNPALIFDAYLRPSSVEMFSKTGVMTHVELEARNEVKWEMYTKKVQIEARVLGDIAINHIVPVATRYLSILLDNMVKIRDLFPGNKGVELSSQDAVTVEKIMGHCSVIKEEVAKMVNSRKDANRIENEREKAIAYSLHVAPCLETIRYHIDKLELLVDNEMWPLPKYRELLFIR